MMPHAIAARASRTGACSFTYTSVVRLGHSHRHGKTSWHLLSAYPGIERAMQSSPPLKLFGWYVA